MRFRKKYPPPRKKLLTEKKGVPLQPERSLAAGWGREVLLIRAADVEYPEPHRIL